MYKTPYFPVKLAEDGTISSRNVLIGYVVTASSVINDGFVSQTVMDVS